MTIRTNARIAGATLLLYIIVGVTQMIVGGRAGRGATTAAKLASMAAHAAEVRISVLLGLLTCVIALTLAAALYSITRDEDRDLALIALVLRVAEGVVGAMFLPMTLALLSMASTSAPNTALADFILTARRINPLIGATLFAGGSAIYAWLFLRGRVIPVALAWLGVIASGLLLIGLPLQIASVLRASVAQLLWIPMAAFEIPLGVWLIVKGVSASREPRPIPR